MKVDMDMLRAMAANGAPVSAIMAVLEVAHAKAEAERASDRGRQRRHRDKSGKSVTSRDKEAEVAEPPRELALVAPDVRRDLFGRGLATLARITGKTPDSCRSLVGKWLKSVSDEAVHVLAAIEDAERNRVVDPVAWINKALQPRTKHGQDRSTTAAAGRLAAKLAEFSQADVQPGIRGEAGAAHVRLLPPGRGSGP